ncbi:MULTISPECIES: hypothetical protein [unclassified Streptomyces]|uniref:hypothetical protein n=1 Tax=unclassified Streptomyces TaxID=2593676 RepID=UPI001661177E|nr:MULTISPECIES: hypothetical protein [unclassified Streptomyces]MBD0712077.1 hypothetical protein [Streptomyces sp. CBMA291]MBD0717938.1 hypothetical protein [Streptomyces sp. CBMA370]
MRQRHHFHIDYLGHSVSVTVQTGHGSVVEVLVDGKETAQTTTTGDRPVTVPVELPTEPPTTVTVRAAPGPGTPRCLLLVEGAAEPQVMAPRPY